MTNPRIGPPQVQVATERKTMEETAIRELEGLADELHALADAVRERVSSASEKMQQTWLDLDEEIGRFRQRVEEATGAGPSDLRHLGFELKRRVRHFHGALKPTPDETHGRNK